MEGWIVGIICVVAVGGFIAYMLWHNIDPFWEKSTLDRALILIKETPIVTPDNVQMFYEKGVAQISHAAVDRGIARAFGRLACRYTTERGQYVIKVVVLQGEIAPESRLPCFRVPINSASPYYNGEWDAMKGSNRKVHYIRAAAQMVAVGTPYGDVMVFPSTGDEAFIENVADHEFEHIGLAHEDEPEFKRTMYHGEGTGHPIIPPCPGTAPVGFATVRDTRIKAVEWKNSEHFTTEARGFVAKKEPYQCVMVTK